MRALPCGESALLIEVDGRDDAAVLAGVHALYAQVREAAWPGVSDLVPAARTLLIVADVDALDGVRQRLLALGDPGASGPEADDAAPVEIGVDYDGPDLDAVAELTGLSRDDVIAAHTGSEQRVAFGGFAPGFPYLTGGDPRLVVPRRPTPRTRVPAGSVALAGPWSGIYPRASPGGWQLIGRTDAVLFDVDRSPPALLQPGQRVRFVPRTIPALDDPPAPDSSATATAPPPRALESCAAVRALIVVAPGPFAHVQDAGRRGHAHIGVTRSGAADATSHRLANRLVGNAEGAAALEITAGGLTVRATASVLVAVTGAHAPATLDGRPVPHATTLNLPAGATLALGRPDAGLRSYLAVGGGFDVAPTLGSRATDTLSGLGPFPLRAGDHLPVGRPTTPPAAATAVTAHLPDGVLDLDYLPGPRADWLADPAAVGATWTVSASTNRVGTRLTGTPLARRADLRDAELPSEGLVRGAVQVPPDGQPVIFGPDHPVTGGYPVVAVLTAAASDTLAQATPGRLVRLRPAARHTR